MTDPRFENHEVEQLQRWSRLSYAERLDWLWQAKLFARRAIKTSGARAAELGARDLPVGESESPIDPPTEPQLASAVTRR